MHKKSGSTVSSIAKSRILANVNTLIVSVDSLQFVTKKRVGFLRLFSLNTVMLIRKEALNELERMVKFTVIL